jgi:ATP-binding cassette subfamily B protein
LIARFWDVTGGSIAIGGRDIREIPLSQLAEMISYVNRIIFCSNCSLKEISAWGKTGRDRQGGLCAASAAQCDEFILG